MNAYTRKLPQLPIVGRWDSNVDFTGNGFGDLAAMAGDPGLRVSRRIVFQTDIAGFRNRNAARPVEILILGDSFGAGMGTTQEKVVSSLLESKYARSTYNLSFPASGPWQQYINFGIESSRLSFGSPGWLIWLLYTGNDLDDHYGETWNLAELPWNSGLRAWKVSYKTFRDRSPIRQMTWHVRWRFKRAKEMAQKVLTERLQDGRPVLFLKQQEEWSRKSRTEIEQHSNFPKLLRTLQEMKTIAAARGLKTVIVVLPTKGEIYRWVLDRRHPRPDDYRPSGFSDAILSFCKRVDLACFDPKSYLIKEAVRLLDTENELLWWSDDTHLGEHGHEAIADFIAHEVVTMRAAKRS
jgi:hypothetical protein